jgi:hypothetical protein
MEFSEQLTKDATENTNHNEELIKTKNIYSNGDTPTFREFVYRKTTNAYN